MLTLGICIDTQISLPHISSILTKLCIFCNATYTS